MFSITTAPAIAFINESLRTSLTMGTSRLLQYPFPAEGITLKIVITLGQVQVHGSFTIRNPTSLTADFSITSFTSGIIYFISPSGLQTSGRLCQTGSPSNTTANVVYIFIEGLQTNNIFFLNTTIGDTSKGKSTRHVLNVHRYDCYYYYSYILFYDFNG